MARAPRRRARFLAASELDPQALGLPRARARELMLARAWRRTAGEAMARQVAARQLRGGELVLSVRDERWATVLREMLPSLAGRLAAQCPELGLRRFRIEGGAGGDLAAQPLPPCAVDAPSAVPAAPAPPDDPAPARTLDERLGDLARAYLARQKA